MLLNAILPADAGVTVPGDDDDVSDSKDEGGGKGDNDPSRKSVATQRTFMSSHHSGFISSSYRADDTTHAEVTEGNVDDQEKELVDV